MVIKSRPDTTSKGKGKKIFFDDSRAAGENVRPTYREVVAEKAPDGGEMLKITIRSSNFGGRRRERARSSPLFCVSQTIRPRGADGPVQQRTVRPVSADGQVSTRGSSGHELQTSMTKIGMWKQNTAKATGWLIKANPPFGQLLSKYVNKKVGRHDRPGKRSHSPN